MRQFGQYNLCGEADTTALAGKATNKHRNKSSRHLIVLGLLEQLKQTNLHQQCSSVQPINTSV